MQKITPCLWFNFNAEEAIEYYKSVFDDVQVSGISRYGAGAPAPEGTILTAVLEMGGIKLMMLNAGPQFPFTEAISLSVSCKNQEEVDKYWDKLTANGGQESMCGWLKDKFGLSWQIVPEMLAEKMKGGDPKKAGNMMQALMQMKKLDIAKLEEAYNAG